MWFVKVKVLQVQSLSQKGTKTQQQFKGLTVQKGIGCSVIVLQWWIYDFVLALSVAQEPLVFDQ